MHKSRRNANRPRDTRFMLAVAAGAEPAVAVVPEEAGFFGGVWVCEGGGGGWWACEWGRGDRGGMGMGRGEGMCGWS